MRLSPMTLGLLTVIALPALAADNETARIAPGLVRAAGVVPDRVVLPERPLADRPLTVERPGPGAFFASVADNAATTQIFRFANAGQTAGAVTATLYDGASGASLGVWTSASIPAGAAVEVTAARIAADATPTLTAAQQAGALNIAVAATFRGTAQLLSKTATVIANQSDCGAGGHTLGYVEGPGFVGASGAVRFVNAGSEAGTITLSLRDAATGTELGTYTSASIPAKGAATVTAAALAAAATPVVPAATVALGVVPTGATARIEIEHLATVTASTTATNLSSACAI